jgi:hypothetical protein
MFLQYRCSYSYLVSVICAAPLSVDPCGISMGFHLDKSNHIINSLYLCVFLPFFTFIENASSYPMELFAD